mmetsp:Transcript_7542/g.22818  ORF Transcript_7542/g.22818 Transcript_7542/m.22818 type:complete len:237 (-) Transcript_7542:280-990(-)
MVCCCVYEMAWTILFDCATSSCCYRNSPLRVPLYLHRAYTGAHACEHHLAPTPACNPPAIVLGWPSVAYLHGDGTVECSQHNRPQHALARRKRRSDFDAGDGACGVHESASLCGQHLGRRPAARGAQQAIKPPHKLVLRPLAAVHLLSRDLCRQYVCLVGAKLVQAVAQHRRGGRAGAWHRQPRELAHYGERRCVAVLQLGLPDAAAVARGAAHAPRHLGRLLSASKHGSVATRIA